MLRTIQLKFLGLPSTRQIKLLYNKLITNLEETFEPFGCLRRGDHITVLIKQKNKEIPGEFLGRLVLGVEDDTLKVFGATIY